jgi:transposase
MDNAPWHKKTIRLVQEEAQPEYSDIRESVIFIKVPPYSPDLNPIEQVWRITRRENTHTNP